jgi:hypothetical protein
MTDCLNTSCYDRVFALDTQMVFEARPLDQLDWQSISTGPVLLLIVPQVGVEVDARKRDGRLAQRARTLNRQLDPSIESGAPVTIVEQPVRVDLAYVAAGLIDWSGLDDLERDNGDDRIVAQALHALVDDPARIELMSFDSRPRAAARRHGLRAFKPVESWLLDPEPSPTDRRVAELEQRVRLLQTTEPELRVSIRALDAEPLTKHRIQPIPDELLETVSRLVLFRHPRERTGGRFNMPSLDVNTRYDEEYDEYEKELRERDIPALHLGVTRQFSSYAIEIVLENAGALAAEHVTVELRSGNSLLHASAFMVDLFGPLPPSTRRDFVSRIPNLSRQLSRPDRTSFVVEESEDPDVQVEYRCEDFRHGRTQTLNAVLELTERTVGAAHVEVRVTAGNMRGDVPARLTTAVTEQDTILGELIDLDNLGLRLAPPTRDLIVAAMQEDEDSLVHYRNDGTERG